MTTPPVLSVSQVEKYDPEQGGCPTRWWFEHVQGHHQGDSTASEDGQQGHRLLAECLRTGGRPGRVRLGKAVNAVIDSGVFSGLPPLGPHLQVEERFSGQPHYDANGRWVPLDPSQTLWHVGHPWDGFIDLRWRSGSTVTVWDHKFSSDIHARALPDERLLRTVQMPIYALDSLRAWPDAEVFNLVHLYVSRRGVESFVRQQCVTAEQVRERAAELIPLVRQMDAARAATRQEDVPFNRAACFARTGCPHQFRCSAFRRKPTMMDLSEEEKQMFGVVSGETPRSEAKALEPLSVAGTGVVTLPLVVPAPEPLGRPNAGRVTPPADLNLDDIFTDLPAASKPKPQLPPACGACDTVFTPENSSRLKSGDLKHIGCPADARAPEPAKLSPRAEQETGGSRCADCPHAAHAGRRCEGKRGKGQCRCGEQVPVGGAPQRPPVPAAPTFEEIEAAAAGGQSTDPGVLSAEEQVAAQRARAADGDGAAVAEAQELQRMADETRTGGLAFEPTQDELAEAKNKIAELEDRLQTMQEIAADPELNGSWSGTLAVNVTVELGPSTLAFLAGLVKR